MVSKVRLSFFGAPSFNRPDEVVQSNGSGKDGFDFFSGDHQHILSGIVANFVIGSLGKSLRGYCQTESAYEIICLIGNLYDVIFIRFFRFPFGFIHINLTI